SPTTRKTTTTSTTRKTTEQTGVAATTAASSSEMTDTLRDLVLKTHNDYRSFLSEGSVRNGKVGKPNLPTATNMLRMKYDFSLEKKAQAFADKCALAFPWVNAGENTYVLQSKSIPVSDALRKSMEEWWEEIYSTSVGKNLRYTSRLQAKRNAPTRFTQMAWANTYKVGCGIKRCSSKTFVVCRYDPPGNIVDKKIYEPGYVCAACSGQCLASLCPTPED
ncbi:SCP-like protein, partial [Necator americanus]